MSYSTIEAFSATCIRYCSFLLLLLLFSITLHAQEHRANDSLKRKTDTLKTVEVTAPKPMVEISADKIILHVENSPTTIGENALDLLRKAPGVQVDNNEELSLMGKNGTIIYINGRPSPLRGQDLAAFLKSTPASMLSTVDIIMNPSAKYDAAGNAGIINLQLKKNKNFGANGSIFAGGSFATYPKYNSGGALNYRNKSINIYGNYNYSNGHYDARNSMLRALGDSLFDQRANGTVGNYAHNISTGIDYTITQKKSVGFMATGLIADKTLNIQSQTAIITRANQLIDRTLVADGNTRSKRDFMTANLNYRYNNPSTGTAWSADADYGIYRIGSNQLQSNIYYQPQHHLPLDSNTYQMLSPSDIDIYSIKTDYEQKAGKGKISMGAKVSYVITDNNFQQFNFTPAMSELDSARSNRFTYRENINALYAIYYRDFKSLKFQLGLRLEQTNIRATSRGYQYKDDSYQSYDSSFSQHYIRLFPSAGIVWNKNPQHQWGLNYSYRIDRPGYRDLNPFEFKLDDYTYQKGNTALKPQYTHSISVTFMYHQKLFTTLNYSRVKDVFSTITDTTQQSKTFITKENLATKDIISFAANYHTQFKWYEIFMNGTTWYSLYNGSFGPGRGISLKAYSCSGNIRQSFHLGKDWTGEVTGFYNSPAILQSTIKAKGQGGVDLGIRKTFWKNAAALSLSISDIFNTMETRFTSDFAGQQIIGSNKEETRQLRMSLSYRFGNKQVKNASQRKAGIEDESKRTN